MYGSSLKKSKEVNLLPLWTVWQQDWNTQNQDKTLQIPHIRNRFFRHWVIVIKIIMQNLAIHLLISLSKFWYSENFTYRRGPFLPKWGNSWTEQYNMVQRKSNTSYDASLHLPGMFWILVRGKCTINTEMMAIFFVFLWHRMPFSE
jgi:hypothetical protein